MYTIYIGSLKISDFETKQKYENEVDKFKKKIK